MCVVCVRACVRECGISFLNRVRLVASVPGAHCGRDMLKWGHMKMRKVDYVILLFNASRIILDTITTRSHFNDG